VAIVGDDIDLVLINEFSGGRNRFGRTSLVVGGGEDHRHAAELVAELLKREIEAALLLLTNKPERAAQGRHEADLDVICRGSSPAERRQRHYRRHQYAADHFMPPCSLCWRRQTGLRVYIESPRIPGGELKSLDVAPRFVKSA
jgi:hypothetical protein